MKGDATTHTTNAKYREGWERAFGNSLTSMSDSAGLGAAEDAENAIPHQATVASPESEEGPWV